MRPFFNIPERHPREREDGFTIAELLIVVAIVGVLVAVAIPVFAGSLESAKEATCLANRRGMYAETVTTAMNGEKTEPEVFEELNAKRAELGYSCPDNGTWTWNQSTRAIFCSEHPREGGSSDVAGDLLDFLNSRKDEIWIGWGDSKAWLNYKDLSGQTAWPKVAAENGDELNLMFKSYDGKSTGMFLYATAEDTNFENHGTWRADYICDTQGLVGEAGTWYVMAAGERVSPNSKEKIIPVLEKAKATGEVELVNGKFVATA